MKPTTVEKETKKGGSSSSGRPEMEALLRAIRAAKEAAEIRGGSAASYLGARAGAMEATFVSAFLRKCLISWRKVSSSHWLGLSGRYRERLSSTPNIPYHP